MPLPEGSLEPLQKKHAVAWLSYCNRKCIAVTVDTFMACVVGITCAASRTKDAGQSAQMKH